MKIIYFIKINNLISSSYKFNKSTLQELILELKSIMKDKLFFVIEHTYVGGYNLYFKKIYAEEARLFSQFLGVILVKEYPKLNFKYFFSASG